MSVGRTIETLGKHTAFAKITEESFCDVLMDDGKARINNFKDKEWPSLPVDEIVKRAQNAPKYLTGYIPQENSGASHHHRLEITSTDDWEKHVAYHNQLEVIYDNKNDL
ncbi:unnamed protein product [Rotaria sp. Silwood1]|nr:unnamed protein product [Rotaria sp. Silwood1]CAF4807012.1 unnamed protein product [Rotaria sp. Silwood1]CAF4907559.1 unnamed protein product [Rotaria sp. Silwood1]